MKCKSEWQRPATAVRIKTSRGPGLGRLTSSITSGLLTSCRTAAFIGYSLNFCYFLKPACLSPIAYAAESNSPTSRIPTARSPSRWPGIARCAEFSVSRNGSLPEKIHAGRIRRQQPRLLGRRRHVAVFAWLVHLPPLFVPPLLHFFPRTWLSSLTCRIE